MDTVTEAEKRAVRNKPTVVHLVEAYEKVGGPPKLVRLIIGSSLREQYEFRVLSYCTSGFDLKALFGLRRQLAQWKPALAHVHGLKSDGFLATLAAKLAGVSPVLVTVHGSSADAITGYRGPVQKVRQWALGHVVEPATLRLADAVYCVCDAMKNQPRVRRHAGARLQETIHNGLPTTPTRNDAEGLRKEFGFSRGDVVLLYAGRIAWDKGLKVLAKAMTRIVREEPTQATSRARRLKLLLVGDGPAFSDLRTCLQPLSQAGRVVMAGRRRDIEQLNAMADFSVLPSFHENLSFALLEAMNEGRAVIATRVGGNPEVVAHGQTGLLVPPHDPAALADAILQLAGDAELRRAMGDAGRQRLVSCFSAETVIRKTGALYESLLARAARARKAPALDSASAELSLSFSAGSCPP
jgi:glycosyltransferase involved in cell wall biosynthesis